MRSLLVVGNDWMVGWLMVGWGFYFFWEAGESLSCPFPRRLVSPLCFPPFLLSITGLPAFRLLRLAPANIVELLRHSLPQPLLSTCSLRLWFLPPLGACSLFGCGSSHPRDVRFLMRHGAPLYSLTQVFAPILLSFMPLPLLLSLAGSGPSFFIQQQVYTRT